MRIFAVRDESLPADKILAYLIYYEKAKAFYIELPDDADPWETPPILSSFVKKGERSVNSYWSRLWVQQRIVPPDRQNIGSILKENGLWEYDDFSLLILSEGRCAQDDCYIEELPAARLPRLLLSRWRTKVEDVVPLEPPRLLVFFRNGETGIVDVSLLTEAVPACEPDQADGQRIRPQEIHDQAGPGDLPGEPPPVPRPLHRRPRRLRRPQGLVQVAARSAPSANGGRGIFFVTSPAGFV